MGKSSIPEKLSLLIAEGSDGKSPARINPKIRYIAKIAGGIFIGYRDRHEQASIMVTIYTPLNIQ